MKAQLLTAFGGPENFQLSEVPKPVVQDGTLLIKLAATSVNSLDIKIREGGISAAPALPGILGSDIAGTVERQGLALLALPREMKSTAVPAESKASVAHWPSTSSPMQGSSPPSL